ncbi:hypothetical protein FBU30_000869 [Linnemannia zychae]|nr:hypothetical protein FBU30_000869 [Linnemannia zychae]
MAPPLTQFRIDGIYLSQNDLVTVLHGYPALSHLMLSRITHINVDFGESDDPNLEVSSILRHKATLKEISAYSYISFGSDEVAHVSSCPKLEILDLHLYEMEMDDIEGGEWVCKDLKKLRIRVYGLNTKESILRTVELWRKGCRERWRKQTIECRREKGQEKAEDMIKTDEQGKERIQDQEEIDTSIEARVARHLLKKFGLDTGLGE